jgi:hypothetical protein
VGQAAAHRAGVPDRGVRDQTDRLGHQRSGHGDLRGSLDLRHRGHRADDQDVAVTPDAAQPGHVTQVDEVPGFGQPEVHQRDQALPAGQHPRFGLGVLGEQSDRLL